MISLSNFAKEISAHIIKLASKNLVRDIDEEPKGCFVAYVDEGDKSFDVRIELNAKGEVLKANCDCNSNIDWCRHQAALLLHLAQDKKPKKQKKIKPKDSFEIILHDLDLGLAKEWIKEICTAHEDLKLAFMHKHTVKDILSITTDEIEKDIHRAIKSIGNRKRAFDTSQINKILLLWKGMHAPIFDKYAANLTNLDLFNLIHSIVTNADEVNFLKLESPKVTSYLNKQLELFIHPLLNIKEDQSWKVAIHFFIDRLIWEEKNSINNFYFQFLVKLVELESKERKKILIDSLVKKCLIDTSNTKVSKSYLIEPLFDAIIHSGYSEIYLQYFEPFTWNNSYNLKLINELIKAKKYDKAEAYAEQQIEQNVNESYSIAYLEILKKLHADQKQEHKLVNTCKRLVPLTFSLDDYKYVVERIDPEEVFIFRKKVLSQTKYRAMADKNLMSFNFEIASLHQDALKMIEFINGYVSLELIDKYKSLMKEKEPIKFLRTLIALPIAQNKSKLNLPKNERDAFDALLNFITQEYPKVDLQIAIQNQRKKASIWSVPGLFEVELTKSIN